MGAFCIRPALPTDVSGLVKLATSLSAQGFLTLPAEAGRMEELVDRSGTSFGGRLSHRDEGEYLFVLEDKGQQRVAGSSLIVARHGTPEKPHVYFKVDSDKKALRLCWDEVGRTELGGLILHPDYRSHTAKLGKRLSYARLHYISGHPEKFLENLLTEFLPPFTAPGQSPFWEAVGRRITGMSYEEADRLSRVDSRFIVDRFPKDEIPFEWLGEAALAVMGKAGPKTQPAVKILTDVGFRYLHEVDPFDGGPHYGALQSEIRADLVRRFLLQGSDVGLEV